MSSSESDHEKKPAAKGPLSGPRSSIDGGGPMRATPHDTKSSSERGRSPVQIPFLFVVKLYELLRDCEHDQDGKGRIISWTPDGKSFKVHKPKEIILSLLPTYFNQTKYKSFQRQLNLWGFDRNTSLGPEKGAYFHPFFQRDQTLVVEKLRRVRAIPKIPAKERRRRQALLKPQQQSPSQAQEVKTKANELKESSENQKTKSSIQLDDGLSALLGVAETLSALRQQPPRAVDDEPELESPYHNFTAPNHSTSHADGAALTDTDTRQLGATRLPSRKRIF